jgi:hypothetical protein
MPLIIVVPALATAAAAAAAAPARADAASTAAVADAWGIHVALNHHGCAGSGASHDNTSPLVWLQPLCDHLRHKGANAGARGALLMAAEQVLRNFVCEALCVQRSLLKTSRSAAAR